LPPLLASLVNPAVARLIYGYGENVVSSYSIPSSHSFMGPVIIIYRFQYPIPRSTMLTTERCTYWQC